MPNTTELNFYKAYHSHPINKLIHMICIPMIAFTLFELFTWLLPYQALNGLIQTDLIIVAWYLYVYATQWPPKVTKIMLVWAVGITCLARYHKAISPDSWKMEALVIHVFSWIAQFVGHAIEGRKPALMDSLRQAFVSAPVFSLEPYIPGMFD